MTLLYLDVDHFKQINDGWGHAVGDRILTFTADSLRAGLREVDTLARLGGDEFAVLLPDTGAASARAVISKVRELLGRHSSPSGPSVTYSIGAVTFPQAPAGVEEAVHRADRLMYRVKRSGRNNMLHESAEREGEPLCYDQEAAETLGGGR